MFLFAKIKGYMIAAGAGIVALLALIGTIYLKVKKDLEEKRLAERNRAIEAKRKSDAEIEAAPDADIDRRFDRWRVRKPPSR